MSVPAEIAPAEIERFWSLVTKGEECWVFAGPRVFYLRSGRPPGRRRRREATARPIRAHTGHGQGQPPGGMVTPARFALRLETGAWPRGNVRRKPGCLPGCVRPGHQLVGRREAP